MEAQQTFLVFGATGRTGRHFTSLALHHGHRVRVLARAPGTLTDGHPHLEIHQGSITDPPDPRRLDRLVRGATAVVCLLGDAQAQRTHTINTTFVQQLVPAMRRTGVTRLLYQAGGLSAPPDRRLPLPLRVVRATIARRYLGQHHDNEAVMRYLATDAMDIEWMVHRAAIGSDGPSRGTLRRSPTTISIAPFADCASYNYRLLADPTAIHTCDPSAYHQ
ncbi:NAD(P)H-binding protein [Amycolatopsis sp. PS_44_ISF1]|uniref:NAD(P)-dependent oxidoreductase n=1 Tax=Amycolatopsis sp. PS_44_ISF1 TaxID=2974917 RepID=UPI0028DD7CD4|nr:NAD(P)H-binding protein [Amycolatopsis sp. PS_44_ISF1]MDT8910030.1 NAD(P)H-binding protein [Amycolatopsis sp. PS_44_ISF1]